MVEASTSERGFKRHDPIPSEYGGSVRVFESSAAMGPHIWVSVESNQTLGDERTPIIKSVAHITLENAELLRDQLTNLIDNHYQV